MISTRTSSSAVVLRASLVLGTWALASFLSACEEEFFVPPEPPEEIEEIHDVNAYLYRNFATTEDDFILDTAAMGMNEQFVATEEFIGTL